MTLNMQKKYNQDGTIKSRGIEWTDATWNPIAGCPHQCRWTMPDGNTAICYAESIAERVAVKAYPHGFNHHYWKPQHLNSPSKAKRPLRIFLGSMSDVFAHEVPTEHIQAVLDVITDTPQHTYQLLTKNALRTKQFDIPDNVWLGASMPPDFMRGKSLSLPQQERMMITTLNALSDANAKVKWMSFEPLSWDVSELVAQYGQFLKWAVIGAASNGNKYYPPRFTDFVNLSTELNVIGAAVFHKGNLHNFIDSYTHGNISIWREEFPITIPSNDPVQLSMF